ncbi:hypothetical protein Tco_0018215 [Tanacetum coccineum]
MNSRSKITFSCPGDQSHLFNSRLRFSRSLRPRGVVIHCNPSFSIWHCRVIPKLRAKCKSVNGHRFKHYFWRGVTKMVYGEVIKKDSKTIKIKGEQSISIALKSRKESSDDDSSTSDSEDEEYTMAMTKMEKAKVSKYQNHLIRECPKLSKYQNQKAFVEGSWSDSDEYEEEKTKDEKCLMAKASNEIQGISKGSDIETIGMRIRIIGRLRKRKSTSVVCTFMGMLPNIMVSKKQILLPSPQPRSEICKLRKGMSTMPDLDETSSQADYGVRLDDIPIMYDNKEAIKKKPVHTLTNKTHVNSASLSFAIIFKKGISAIEKVCIGKTNSDILN